MHPQELALEIVEQVSIQQFSHIFFMVLFTTQRHVGYFMSHPQMPYYSSILPSVIVNRAPHTLLAKIKSNHSQGTGGDTFESPTFLSHVQVPTGGRVGAGDLKPSTLKPCHIVRQLGAGLDSVNGGEGCVFRTNFLGVAKVKWEGGIIAIITDSIHLKKMSLGWVHAVYGLAFLI